MATVERTITVQQPIEKVWAYVSDWTTTERWDPPSVSTKRTSGDGGVGTTYRNVSRFGRREATTEYTVTAFEPPRRFQLKGKAGKGFDLIDTITLEPTDGPAPGTRLTYHAEFVPLGTAKLIAPLLPLMLNRLAGKVVPSLEQHLARL